MLGIDEDWITNAVRGLGDGVGVFVDGDAENGEVLIGEFFVEFLPPGQVKDASSPTGECDQQLFLSFEVVESYEGTGQIGERKVWRHKVVDGLTPRCPRCPNGHDVGNRIMNHRSIECLGDGEQIDSITIR